MEDQQIIALYFARSQQAISASERRYGPYCRSIAYNILKNREDSEECVNDTWLKAWDAMPPQRPAKLSAFFGAITRNLALHRWEAGRAQRRGSGQTALALEELGECIPCATDPDAVIDGLALRELLNRFLQGLSEADRRIFLRRYWYLCPVKDIARMEDATLSRIKMSLHRSRLKLRNLLEKEGFTL